MREIKEKRAFLAHAFREFEVSEVLYLPLSVICVNLRGGSFMGFILTLIQLQAIKEQYEQEKSQALHEYEVCTLLVTMAFPITCVFLITVVTVNREVFAK